MVSKKELLGRLQRARAGLKKAEAGQRKAEADKLKEQKKARALQKKSIKHGKEAKSLKSEINKARRQHKAVKHLVAKLQVFEKALPGYLEHQKAKALKYELRVNRRPIIANIFKISRREDLDSDEREDMLDRYREMIQLDLDTWLEIMAYEGYREHEAYELWYYP